MMLNVPKGEEFLEAGRETMNFAWSTCLEPVKDLHWYGESAGYPADGEESERRYWVAEKRSQLICMTLVHQATELFLKGMICEISPYLLLADGAPKWPSPYAEQPIDLAELRTIDAQDLVRTVDSVSALRLSEQFRVRFEKLRRSRNLGVHSTGSSLEVKPAEIVEAILFIHRELFPNRSWTEVRRGALENGRDSELSGVEAATNTLSLEVQLACGLLRPAHVKAYFGFEKKKKRYMCPQCHWAAYTKAGFDVKLATLISRKVGETLLFCPLHPDPIEVERNQCGHCGDDVEHEGFGCLSCVS
jgi:hypothetical protein